MQPKKPFNFMNNEPIIQYLDNLIIDNGYNNFKNLTAEEASILFEDIISRLSPQEFFSIIKLHKDTFCENIRSMFLEPDEEAYCENMATIFVNYLHPFMEDMFEERLTKINCENDIKDQMRKIVDKETGEVLYVKI